MISSRLLVVSTLLLLSLLLYPYFLTCLFFTSCVLRDAAEQLGEIIKLCMDSAKDPLLDIVGVLESNWRNVRNVL
jgi:hypothetical protein